MLYNPIPVARFAFPITPADTGTMQANARGIYVGGAGNITVKLQDSTIVLFTAVPVGTILSIEAVQVMATGTTATALVGLSA